LRPRLSAGLLINADAIDSLDLPTAQSVAVFTRCHMQTVIRARKKSVKRDWLFFDQSENAKTLLNTGYALFIIFSRGAQ
jgi:hypothetical protein